MFEKMKINEKEAGVGPFFKKKKHRKKMKERDKIRKKKIDEK